MNNLSLILLVFAFVLTLIAAFWRGGPWPGGFPVPPSRMARPIVIHLVPVDALITDWR
jgi:hypothetical protein